MTSANDVESVPATAVTADVAEDNQVSRRNLIRNAAIAGGVVAAGVGLAACSSNNTSAGTTSGSGNSATGASSATTSAAAPPASTGGAPAAGGTPLAATSAIPVGGGTIFADKKVVVTQPVAGTFKAFSSTCTHLGCTVAKVADGLIQCPCHGSRYSIVDASVKAGPAPRPLPPMNITVTGGEITLNS
jgi:Rieske Fe-S protein